MEKKEDFHFRMDGLTRKSILDAAGKITINGHLRRSDLNPTSTAVLIAFIEAGLESRFSNGVLPVALSPPRRSAFVSDFHFRLVKEMKEDLYAVAKESGSTVSGALRAFIEAGLDRVRGGDSVVEVPSMRRVAARQEHSSGEHLAPLNSLELYGSIAFDMRPVTSSESELLDLDARHVHAGAKMFLRGTLFTDTTRHKIPGNAGDRVSVVSAKGRIAQVRFGRRDAVPIDVYDLAPYM